MKYKEKIGFFIGSFGHAQGGHHWDLKVICDALSTSYECTVFEIGPSRSSVLQFDNVDVLHFKRLSLSNIRMILKTIEKKGITELITFDLRISVIPALVSRLKKIPLVFFKAGGPNVTNGFPVFGNIICVSRENYEDFHNRNKFKGSKVFLLPNRVNRPFCDLKRIKELEGKWPRHKFNLLLVIRISEEYQSVLNKAIDYLAELTKDYPSLDCGLTIIGVPQSKIVLNSIKNMTQSLPIYIETDSKYTKSASELIYGYDIVIGNGRTIMESCAAGKPTILFSNNIKRPLVLTGEVFEQAFYYNFSPRFIFSSESYNEEIMLNNIFSPTGLRLQATECSNFYEENFSTDNLPCLYKKIFHQVQVTKLGILSLARLLLTYFRAQISR